MSLRLAQNLKKSRNPDRSNNWLVSQPINKRSRRFFGFEFENFATAFECFFAAKSINFATAAWEAKASFVSPRSVRLLISIWKISYLTGVFFSRTRRSARHLNAIVFGGHCSGTHRQLLNSLYSFAWRWWIGKSQRSRLWIIRISGTLESNATGCWTMIRRDYRASFRLRNLIIFNLKHPAIRFEL